MARDREIVCKSYICEGQCKKGRAGTFRNQCQTCDKYDPVKGALPARRDLRQKKNDKFMKDKRNWD